MVTLNQSEGDFRSGSGFHTVENGQKFIDFYKSKFTSLRLTIGEKDFNLFDIECLYRLQRDHENQCMILNFNAPSLLYCSTIGNQLAVQCSSISFNIHNRYDPLLVKLYNDLFYLMHYTLLFISFTSTTLQEKYESEGFIPVVKCKNRRTANTITIMFKQLTCPQY